MIEEQDDNPLATATQSDGSKSTNHAHQHQPNDNGEQLTTRFSNTPAIRSFLLQSTKKNKRDRVRDNTDTYWFIFLILTSLSPPNLKMNGQQNVRTLFDPMVGEFCADTSSNVIDKFFNSGIRWRDDMSWKTYEIQANMMMISEPAILMRGSSNPAGTNNSNPQPTDPTTLDYDAIDVFWRQDIEREKGIAPFNPMQYANDGQCCSTSGQMCSTSDVSEQFERDLQLLREKSLFTTLNSEESFRYQNLSKIHYADFYRTVPSAAAKRWHSASNSSSTSGYSNNTDNFMRPMSPAKSNISSFDENEAANFFSNLAKQSMMEESRPIVPQQLPTYSNLTLCTDQSNVINNVSLAHEANLPGVWANDTFFMSNQSENGIRGSSVNEESSVSDDLFEVDHPLEISESEASAIWSSMQNSDDLNDAVNLHEFVGMEMLGEFQQNSTNFDARIDSPIPESIILTSLERERSPSSGIGSSMQSSSSSPNYMGDEDQQEYRFYHKLAPKIRHQQSSFSADNFRRPSQRKQTKSRIDQDVAAQRKRGRQSKDEQLAQDNNLPASAEEFAAMSHMEIQKFMRDPKLSALQKSLIKKIRRRGRNKIAARKCRQSRVNPGGSNDYFVKDEPYDPAEIGLYDY